MAAPDIPWLEAGAPPVAWTCPEGWRALGLERASVCDPYPLLGPADCPAGQAHFPGEPGCAVVGRACGTEPFADAGSADALFVDATAAVGGVGTRAAPFASLAAAFAEARPGQSVFVAAGVYFVPADAWPDGVSLRGRCARDTRLVVGPSARAVAAIESTTEPVVISDVTLGSSERPGVIASGEGTEVTLEGVVVSQTRATAEAAAALTVRGGAQMDARSVVIEDTRASPDGTGGGGIDASDGAALTLQRAVLRRNRTFGVILGGTFEGGFPVAAGGRPPRATLEDVHLTGTLPQPSDDRFGVGVLAAGGASLVLRRALLSDLRESGVAALGEGTSAELLDVVMRDVAGRVSDVQVSGGIGAALGARIQVERTLVERSSIVALSAGNEGSHGEFTNVVVRGVTRAAGDDPVLSPGEGMLVVEGATAVLRNAVIADAGRMGVFAVLGAGAQVHDVRIVRSGVRAIDVGGGSRLTLGKALLEDSAEFGLFVSGDPTSAQPTVMEAMDLVVVGETSDVMTEEPRGGAVVQLGGRLLLTRVAFRRCGDVGLTVGIEGALADLTDVSFRDSRPRPGRPSGRGIVASDGAELRVHRGLLERLSNTGISLRDAGTRAVLQDLLVRDTRASENLNSGAAMNVEAGAELALTRAVLERNVWNGLTVVRTGARAVLEDVIVRDTQPNADGTRGSGIGLFGGSLRLTRGIVERSVGAGVAVGIFNLGPVIPPEASSAELEDVVVRDTVRDAASAELGYGVGVSFGGSLTARRTLLERSFTAGIVAFQAAVATEDLVVRDVRSQASDGAFGWGVGVQGERSSLTMARTVIERSREAGVLLRDVRATLEDLAVSDTDVAGCEPDCGGALQAAGSNLVALGSADVSVDGFVLGGATSCGVQVNDEALLTLANGVVQDYAIGACLSDPDYPLRLLRPDSVRYLGPGPSVETRTFRPPDLIALDDL